MKRLISALTAEQERSLTDKEELLLNSFSENDLLQEFIDRVPNEIKNNIYDKLIQENDLDLDEDGNAK